MGWNLTSHYAHCWRCRGHHPAYVLRTLGAGREQAEEVLASLTQGTPIKREITRVSLQEPKGRGPLLAAHRKYLRERGFDPKEISRIWGVEGIGMDVRLGWRLYIPITYQGVRVSWTTRSISLTARRRYISASAEQESMNHKSILYGVDLCHHSIVVVEGPTDAWAVGPGAAATFGTAFTTAQVNEIARFPYRFICFDASPEAQRNAVFLANQLSCFPGTTENVVLFAKDPGCAPEKELRALRKLARL